MQVFVATILLMTILPGNSVKPRAATTGPVPADGEDYVAPLCSMCCQGPAAVPGIPGLPGQQGQTGPYGPVGSKGDIGEPGQKGEMGQHGTMGQPGTHGSPGPKGDDGIGLPGKIGPRGPPGLVGLTGEAGVKGQKGEPGETLDDYSNHRVAFTVRRRSSTDASSDVSTRLPFEETVTLMQGTSFDLETGSFSCSVPGTYVFMFSACKYPDSTLSVHLHKNNNKVVSGLSGSSSEYEQVSGGAVLVLQRGDSVYLTIYGRANSGTPYRYTSFSGFLLYAE